MLNKFFGGGTIKRFVRSLLTTDKTVSTAGLYAADAKSIYDLKDDIGKIKIDQLYASTNTVAAGTKISIPNLSSYDFIYIIFYSHKNLGTYSSGDDKVASVSHLEKYRTDCAFVANMSWTDTSKTYVRILSRWGKMEADGITFHEVHQGYFASGTSPLIESDNTPKYMNPRYIYGIKAL